MRTLVIAVTALAGLAGSAAAQERVAVREPGARYPAPRVDGSRFDRDGYYADDQVYASPADRPHAIDRAEDRRRSAPPPSYGYGAGYPPPDAYGADYPPPPPLPFGGGYVTPDVRTYAVPPGVSRTVLAGPGVTTVIVTAQPMTTTTTTTEYRDEAVTYTRPAKRTRASKTRPRRRR